MKSVWLYRVSAIIFVLFAAGHTFGFLSFRPGTPEGLAVWDGMNRVPLAEGSTLTYGGFYKAFGLSIGISTIFSAFLSWHLSGIARHAPQTIGLLGWAFCLTQLGGIVLSWIYFEAPQVIFSAVVAICLGWAALALPKPQTYAKAQPS